MDNSIEKINRHSTYAERLPNIPIPSINDIDRIDMNTLHNEFSKEPVNVGTPGYIDHGSNSSIQELSPGTYEISADVNATRRSAIMRDYQPEDIEYEMDDWKKAKPMLWNCDARNSGKKRDKAKAKAQKKARKLTRRK